MSMEKDVNEVF